MSDAPTVGAGSTEQSDPGTDHLRQQSEWRPQQRARLIFDAVLILVGVGYLALTLELPFTARRGPGPGLFPLVAVTLLLACTIADGIRLLLDRAKWERGAGRVPRGVFTVLGALLGYFLAVGFLGHAITATLVVLVLLIQFSLRPLWQMLITAVIAGFGSYFLFGEVLGLRLPDGLLFEELLPWM